MMITITSLDEFEKYKNEYGNYVFDDSVYFKIDIISYGYIRSDGDIISGGDIISDGDIRGNVKKVFGIKTKHFVEIHHYYVIQIIDTHIKIGCELHTRKEWEKFIDKEILAMDGKKGLKWWKENKKWVLGINFKDK